MWGRSRMATTVGASLLVGGSLLTSGCAAALIAPTLATSGGTYAFVKSEQKNALRETSATTAPYDTAEAIKGNVEQRDVRVTNFVYRKHMASWSADTPRGCYSCWRGDNDLVATCSSSMSARR